MNKMLEIFRLSGKIISFLLLFTSALTFAQNTDIVTYQKSNEIIKNPERGFFAAVYSPLTSSFIKSIKTSDVTTIRRVYTLPNFRDKLFSDSLLTIIKNDFTLARDAGMKMIVRFSYINNSTEEDAPLNIILTHITQLKPIFEENYDIIAYLEAGFIGAWGEWYYSSNGLGNTEDRRTVLFALLDALPVERMVQVRTPSYKRDIFEDNKPLTEKEAYNDSYKARTGAHNDCFVASATDLGTYIKDGIEIDKEYLSQDNKYVPQGGETCKESEYSGCSNSVIDLARMHWSLINKDYKQAVIKGWEDGLCLNDIKRKLGYRFNLIKGEYSNIVKPGGIMSIKFSIYNDGYAALFNPRNLEFILRSKQTNKQYRFVSEIDPRTWKSGDTAYVELNAGILPNIKPGNYELLIHLADPTETLHDRFEYSIQLANQNVWEKESGFNNLSHTVNISTDASGNNYTGDDFFKEDNYYSEIIIDGKFGDWNAIEQLDKAPDEESVSDGINSNVDLKDIWVTNNKTNLYLSYSLDGNFTDGYFYHVFFDLDKDSNSGYHIKTSYGGAEMMIENNILYKYTGDNSSWSWSNVGVITAKYGISETNRIEMAVSREKINEIYSSKSIEIIFNINNKQNNGTDDFAPNAYQKKSYNYTYIKDAILTIKNDINPRNLSLNIYPNPFNNVINIDLQNNHGTIKRARIYDIQGRIVKSFSRDKLEVSSILWNAKSDDNRVVASGVYFLVVETNSEIFSKKMVLIK